jgi:hypothetical protein
MWPSIPTTHNKKSTGSSQSDLTEEMNGEETITHLTWRPRLIRGAENVWRKSESVITSSRQIVQVTGEKRSTFREAQRTRRRWQLETADQHRRRPNKDNATSYNNRAHDRRLGSNDTSSGHRSQLDLHNLRWFPADVANIPLSLI